MTLRTCFFFLIFSSFLLFIPSLIGLYLLNRKKYKWIREYKRRKREELSRVKFDIGNPKQVIGAFLAFFLGPVSMNIALSLFLFNISEWFILFQYLLVLFGMASFIIGFNMFYNRTLFGPYGELSLMGPPVDPAKTVSFYQCHICNKVNGLGIGEVPKDLICRRCGSQLYQDGKMVDGRVRDSGL